MFGRRRFKPGGWLRIGMLVGLLPVASCSGGEEQAATGEPEATGFIRSIQGRSEFEQALADAGQRLVVIDLFAEWCMPCKLLSPILEEVAREKRNEAVFYKIDIDRNRDIARSFGVTGIPLVVFLRQGERVHALTGLQPKGAYERAVERFAAPAATSSPGESPDGELVDGIRVIRIGALVSPGNLHVYRGETVKIIFEGTGSPFAVSIPDLRLAESSAHGDALVVTFKAADVGVYAIYCNGRCPVGEGERLGQVIVVPFEAEGDARFTELTAEQAKRMTADRELLVLDVRTPNEFYDGHIENALLIPLHQLEGRIAEIGAQRDQPVLLYCRSGNRSTVAAEILVKHGFKSLYHLRHGIQDWQRQGYPVVRQLGS